MSFADKIKKYARLAVKTGVNIQPGQLLVIQADVDCAWYVRKVVEAAYEAGAGDVEVVYNDGEITKLRYLHVDEKTLGEYPSWHHEQRKNAIDRGAAFLSIGSSNPLLLRDVDSKKMHIAQMAQAEAMKDLRYYTGNNIGQWSVELLPNETWAGMVHPGAENAVDLLWDDIFSCCRIDDEHDPVEVWAKHSASIVEHGKKLTAYQFQKLHIQNKLGTDITIGLVADHQWEGGMEWTPDHVGFVPNLPTEEIFCMPHRDKADGIVYATRPLLIQGKLVKDFWFRFERGEVVDFGASENVASLENLLKMDEGARHLGELALISDDSPISQKNRLFYNGLIDENASCHMALGACYPYNIRGGTEMSEEELKARGANFSLTHCDFMYGSPDLSIIGTLADGSEVVVFKDGNFVF